MARKNAHITQPADDTTKPDVDEREPIASEETGDETDETSEDAPEQADRSATTRTEDGPGVKKTTRGTAADATKDQPEAGREAQKLTDANSEPNVSAGGGDGATMTPAIGTSREMASRLSTKEGDAPIGVERDSGFVGDDPTGPKSEAAAMMSHRLPAGTIAMSQPSQEVHAGVVEVINDFGSGEDRETMSGVLNLFDDLGVQRAHIVHLAAKIEEKFGIDITPSEAQNFLLVRDVVNLTLRKLARKR